MFFLSPLYHRASLLINILIREPMARTVIHFSISHVFSVAGTTMPRLGCCRSHLNLLMRECVCTSDSDYPLSVFMSGVEGGDVCSDLKSMWVLSPLQQVALRHDGIFTHLLSISLKRWGIIGKVLQSVQTSFYSFILRQGMGHLWQWEKHIPAITSSFILVLHVWSIYQLVLYLY